MDSVSYFGSPKIPIEIPRALNIIPLISQPSLRKVVLLVSNYISGENLTNYDPKVTLDSKESKEYALTTQMIDILEKEVEANLSKLKKKYQMDQAALVQKVGVFSFLFTTFYDMIRLSIRQKLDSNKFGSQLVGLKFDADVVKLLKEVYAQKYDALLAQSERVGSWFNQVVGVRWRVDVTISTSQLNRVFKPYLLMQLELSNNEIKTFECSLKQFHELRLVVSTVLNDMNTLESHRIMQIVEK